MTQSATAPVHNSFRIRQATAADNAAIAELHIANMQETYASFLSVDYLANKMPPERRGRWAQRFGAPHPTQQYITLVADGPSDELAGFVCLVLDSADRWGILLDSLHIDPAYRGRGLGKQLLRLAIAELDATQMAMPMHLLVYEDNVEARRLYDALKGKIVERLPRDFGLNGVALIFRYLWDKTSDVADALG